MGYPHFSWRVQEGGPMRFLFCWEKWIQPFARSQEVWVENEALSGQEEAEGEGGEAWVSSGRSFQSCRIPAFVSSLVHWTSRRFENKNGDPRVIFLWHFQILSQLIKSCEKSSGTHHKVSFALLWPRIQNPGDLILMRSFDWHFFDMFCSGKRICFFISEV